MSETAEKKPRKPRASKKAYEWQPNTGEPPSTTELVEVRFKATGATAVRPVSDLSFTLGLAGDIDCWRLTKSQRVVWYRPKGEVDETLEDDTDDEE